MEAAVEVAQAARAATPPLTPPRQLRPFLGLRRLPDRGLAPIRQALEEDLPFRELVAKATTEDLVGRASFLWLCRPEGWEDELQSLVVAERSGERTAADEKARATALRRLDAVEASLAKGQRDLAAAKAEVGRLRDQLGEERRARRAADADVERLRRAVAEAEARAMPAEPPAAVTAVDSLAGEALAALIQERDALIAELEGLRARSKPAEAAVAEAAPSRRVPVGLPPAVFDDSPAAADHLVRVGGVLVLVDGYNVAMHARPGGDLVGQRQWLLDAANALAARTGAEVHLVFDGAGGRTTAPAQGPRRAVVHVRYTATGHEADDELLGLLADAPPGRPVVMVSSDHRVASGAIAVGANVLSASTFVALLRR
jgi:predicted RNA-binding protein with PIN domain